MSARHCKHPKNHVMAGTFHSATGGTFQSDTRSGSNFQEFAATSDVIGSALKPTCISDRSEKH